MSSAACGREQKVRNLISCSNTMSRVLCSLTESENQGLFGSFSADERS